MKFLLYMNVVMLLSGGVTSIIMSSRNYLISKGYSEQYILEKQKFNKWAGLLQLLTLLLAQFIALLIVKRHFAELNQAIVMTYIVPSGILVLLPVSILLSVSFNKKYKKLAQETGESVVIDFDFKVLKRIFDIRFEIPFLLVVLTICFVTLESKSFMTMLFSSLVPWVFFLVLRFSKSMNKASYKESYQLAIIFSRIYLVMLPAVYIIFTLEGMSNMPHWKVALVIVNMTLFAYKLVVSFIKFPGISKEIEAL